MMRAGIQVALLACLISGMASVLIDCTRHKASVSSYELQHVCQRPSMSCKSQCALIAAFPTAACSMFNVLQVAMCTHCSFPNSGMQHVQGRPCPSLSIHGVTLAFSRYISALHFMQRKMILKNTGYGISSLPHASA